MDNFVAFGANWLPISLRAGGRPRQKWTRTVGDEKLFLGAICPRILFCAGSYFIGLHCFIHIGRLGFAFRSHFASDIRRSGHVRLISIWVGAFLMTVALASDEPCRSLVVGSSTVWREIKYIPLGNVMVRAAGRQFNRDRLVFTLAMAVVVVMVSNPDGPVLDIVEPSLWLDGAVVVGLRQRPMAKLYDASGLRFRQHLCLRQISTAVTTASATGTRAGLGRDGASCRLAALESARVAPSAQCLIGGARGRISGIGQSAAHPAKTSASAASNN